MRREPDPKGAQLTVEKPHEYSATWSERYAENRQDTWIHVIILKYCDYRGQDECLNVDRR